MPSSSSRLTVIFGMQKFNSINHIVVQYCLPDTVDFRPILRDPNGEDLSVFLTASVPKIKFICSPKLHPTISAYRPNVQRLAGHEVLQFLRRHTSRDASAMLKSRKLEKAMSVIRTDDADGHKQIYSYSVEHMDPQGVPHIAALIYGSARVLLPEMHWDSTPELLDIFALAEEVRQQTVADTRDALLWDQFYRKDEAKAADGEPLTDEERKTLKTIVKKSTCEANRDTYRTVVMQVCWAHIHRLRRSNETFLLAQVFPRYFPSVGDLGRLESTDQCPLWLRGLSHAELSSYEVTRDKVMDFLEDVEVWEEEYLTHVSRAARIRKAPRNSAEYQKEFCSRFPLIVGWEVLTGILQRHLTKIQSMAAKLHSIFPESPSESYVEDSEADTLLRGRVQRKTNVGRPTHPFSRLESRATIQNLKAASDIQEEHAKKESQDSNVSSILSYVDVPENIAHALPTSLLDRVERS